MAPPDLTADYKLYLTQRTLPCEAKLNAIRLEWLSMRDFPGDSCVVDKARWLADQRGKRLRGVIEVWRTLPNSPPLLPNPTLLSSFPVGLWYAHRLPFSWHHD